jgi:hypothetical protein
LFSARSDKAGLFAGSPLHGDSTKDGNLFHQAVLPEMPTRQLGFGNSIHASCRLVWPDSQCPFVIVKGMFAESISNQLPQLLTQVELKI